MVIEKILLEFSNNEFHIEFFERFLIVMIDLMEYDNNINNGIIQGIQ